MDIGTAQYVIGIAACTVTVICLVIVLAQQHYAGQRLNEVGVLFTGLVASIGYAYAVALDARLLIGCDGYAENLQSFIFETRTIAVTLCVVGLAWRVGLRVFKWIFQGKKMHI